MAGVWARQCGEIADGIERAQPQQGLSLSVFPPFKFYPHSGPLRGSTRLTLCGSNFYVHPFDLAPEGTYRVTVGHSPCQLLPKDTSNLRYSALPAFPVPDGGSQRACWL